MKATNNKSNNNSNKRARLANRSGLYRRENGNRINTIQDVANYRMQGVARAHPSIYMQIYIHRYVCINKQLYLLYVRSKSANKALSGLGCFKRVLLKWLANHGLSFTQAHILKYRHTYIRVESSTNSTSIYKQFKSPICTENTQECAYLAQKGRFEMKFSRLSQTNPQLKLACYMKEYSSMRHVRQNL